MTGFMYVTEFDLKHPWLTTILRVGTPVLLIVALICWKKIFPAANIRIPSRRTWLVCFAVVLASVGILAAFDWLVFYVMNGI